MDIFIAQVWAFKFLTGEIKKKLINKKASSKVVVFFNYKYIIQNFKNTSFKISKIFA